VAEIPFIGAEAQNNHQRKCTFLTLEASALAIARVFLTTGLRRSTGCVSDPSICRTLRAGREEVHVSHPKTDSFIHLWEFFVQFLRRTVYQLPCIYGMRIH
jgi:hypothetical protein